MQGTSTARKLWLMIWAGGFLKIRLCGATICPLFERRLRYSVQTLNRHLMLLRLLLRMNLVCRLLVSITAAAEFHKILDHPGIVLNESIGALAHLNLGRAYTISGDAAKARAAYQDFLALWKDADPDIPILKQAKAEYAKLP